MRSRHERRSSAAAALPLPLPLLPGYGHAYPAPAAGASAAGAPAARGPKPPTAEPVTFSTVRSWTPQDVSEFLRRSNLGQYVPLFERNDIEGTALFLLDQVHMKEMGVASVGDRLRLHAAIRTLHKRCSDAESEPRSSPTSMSSSAYTPTTSHAPPMGRARSHSRSPAPGAAALLAPPGAGLAPPSTLASRRPNTSTGATSGRPRTAGATASPTSVPGLRAVRRPATTSAVAGAGGVTGSGAAAAPSAPPQQQVGYAVGRGAFGPRSKVGQISAPYNLRRSGPLEPDTSAEQRGLRGSADGTGRPTLEELKRTTIKFFAENGSSRIVDVSECRSEADLLARVQRKFGLELGTDAPWAIAMEVAGGQRKVLSGSELMTVCQAPHAFEPVWQQGLFLKPAAPTCDDAVTGGSVTTGSTIRRRASTVSVLSGLGIENNALSERTDAGPSKAEPAPPPPRRGGGVRRRARNFFGQRPPSELISSHLADYFPLTERRLLERFGRKSEEPSQATGAPPAPDAPAGRAPEPPPAPAPAAPSMPSTGPASPAPARAVAAQSGPAPATDTPSFPPGAPHYSVWSDNSLSTQGDSQGSAVPSTVNMSRYSLLPHYPDSQALETPPVTGAAPPARRSSTPSSRRVPSEKRDTASLLTVDEITQGLERRKLSPDHDEPTSAVIVDADGVPIPAGGAEQDSTTTASTVSSVSGEALASDSGEAPAPAPSPAPTSAASGSHFHWHKGALIGAGSFGSVFLGMKASTGLLMAVKQVELPESGTVASRRRQEMIGSLESEIELLKTLEHPNIVQYLDSYADGQYLYIFLEYVPGGSVASLLRSYGAFEEQLVQNFVRQVLHGLAFLHGRDIVHRDIKGANILVDNKGGVKISDFGISKKVENGLLLHKRSNRPSLQGTVYWMAPEVVKQITHTHKADIWSVGCLVLEMISGTHPWAGLDQMQALFRIGMSAKPTQPEEISPLTADFLAKTFEGDYRMRPEAAELLEHPFVRSAAPEGAGPVSGA